MKRHFKNLITHPLFSGSAIMIFGSNGASALNYLYHLMMGRLLGPSFYGELASLISVIGLIGIIPNSISLVIIKEISSAKNEQEVNSLIVWFKKKIYIISLIFSIIILFLSPFISSFLHINQISYLFIIAILFFFSLQSGFNRAILQGLLKFKEVVISIIIENGVKLALSIILVYIGFQVLGAMFALLLSAILGFYITLVYLKVKESKNFFISPRSKSMLKFAIPVILQTISITSLYTTDVILVKHFFSSHDSGIYASLSTLGKIIFFATTPISSVMFPLISQRKAKGENFKRIFIYSLFLTALCASCALMIYWLFPALVINLLFGSAYLGSENLLVWFGLFISLFTLSTVVVTYNLSIGKTKVTFLPIIAAISQICLITLFHQTLFLVILISTTIAALLLLSLLIYSSYDNGISK